MSNGAKDLASKVPSHLFKPLPTDSLVKVDVTEAFSPSEFYLVSGENQKILDFVRQILSSVDESHVLDLSGKHGHLVEPLFR